MEATKGPEPDGEPRPEPDRDERPTSPPPGGRPPGRRFEGTKRLDSQPPVLAGLSDDVDGGPQTGGGRQLTDQTIRTSPGRPKPGSRRRLVLGGTLMAALPTSSVPAPVELEHVTGQHKLQPDHEKAAGRYVLGQELGRGGMGVVRLVKDLDIGRHVAMKTLHADDPDAEGLIQPLIHEAQTTGQLEHPNIIPVYELGVLPDGDVFYTMKAVTGLCLKDVLRGLRKGEAGVVEEYSLRRLLSIFGQICLALHYAHSRGVIHRDLKPDNVLLGSYGEVLVMDWGIAHVLGRTSDPLAQPGVVVGTPHYMAPEQSRGEIHAVDARSDIFSLGVILYEILTLRTPITESDTDRALEAIQTYRGPTEPMPADGSRPVPPALAEVVLRAMAPEPQDRYPNARMLFKEIEGYLEGDAEREQARRMAAKELGLGLQLYDRYMQHRRNRERQAQRIERREQEVHRWDPPSVKRDLWDQRARHRHMGLTLSRAFSTAVNQFHKVLGLVDGQPQARAALANLYWTQFESAEEQGDYEAMIFFADQVLKFNDTERGGPLRGGSGRITVRSFPQGADIVLFDFSEGNRSDAKGIPDVRLETGKSLGASPVSDVELPMGIYLLAGHKEGYQDAHIPIFVRPDVSRTYLMPLKPWAAEQKLVGREGELAKLKYNFERTMGGRQVRRALIAGADGSGKDRLLSAFTDYLDSLSGRATFIFAVCHEHHSLVPYAPITEGLRIAAGIAPGDSPDLVRTKLRALIEDAVSEGGPPTQKDREHIDGTAAVLSRLPGMASGDFRADLPPAKMRDVFDQALLDFVQLVTRWEPALFVLDAVEYMDDATTRVITSAPRFLTQSPLMVLGLGSEPATLPVWDECISLLPLGETDVDALLRDLLKGRLPPGLHSFVMRRSAGIPWLVTETVRLLAERYDLYSTEGHWYLKDGLEPALPINMYEARRQMVCELPDRLQAALRVAAVIGDVFWVEALGDLGVADPEQCVAELTERELVRTLPDSRYPNTRAQAFRSLLFREVVYDTVADTDELVRLHTAVADWMRKRFCGDIREAAELAHHVEMARDEPWAALLYGQMGDVCRDCGCFGMARECYLRALTNAVETEDREVLEARLEAVRGVH